MEDLFSVLCDRTFDILQSQNISVGVFRARLSNLSVRNKQLHKEFLGLMLSRLDRNSTLEDIWERLSLYCNFLNYSLMEHVVKKFGDEALKTEFQEFKEQLKAFRLKTRLCDVAKHLRMINETLSKQDITSLVVNFNKSWEECTLEDIETSRKGIAQKLFLPSYFFVWLDAKPGCISMTWAIPTIITEALKESMDRADIVEFCIAQGITSLHLQVGRGAPLWPQDRRQGVLQDCISRRHSSGEWSSPPGAE